jgi:hypothetical protein
MQFGDPGAYAGAQHLCPLIWPGIPLVVELHRYPNSPEYLSRRRADEIIELGVPSAIGVDGVPAPAPPPTSCCWWHMAGPMTPLGRLQDLVDVAPVLSPDERKAARALAGRWGWDGMWHVATAHVDAILGDDPAAGAVAAWARHLCDSRSRTVLGNHLARLAAPASALPLTRKPGGVAWGIMKSASRHRDESWRSKARGSRLAVVHAFMDRPSHELTLRR